MEHFKFRGSKEQWQLDTDLMVNSDGVDYLVIDADTSMDSIEVYADHRIEDESERIAELYADARVIAASKHLLFALQEMVKQNEIRGYAGSQDYLQAQRALKIALGSVESMRSELQSFFVNYISNVSGIEDLFDVIRELVRETTEEDRVVLTNIVHKHEKLYVDIVVDGDDPSSKQKEELTKLENSFIDSIIEILKLV